MNRRSKIKERKIGMLFDSVTFSFKRAIEEAAAEGTTKAEARAEAEKEEMKRAVENALRTTKYIAKMLANGHSDTEIIKALQHEFGLTKEQAAEEYRKVIE